MALQQNMKSCSGCGDWRRPYDLQKVGDYLFCFKCRKIYTICENCKAYSKKENLNKLIIDNKEVYICNTCFKFSPSVAEKFKSK